MNQAGIDGTHIKPLSEKQVQCIQKHLQLVFKHDIDPQAGNDTIQDQLNAIHKTGGGSNLKKLILLRVGALMVTSPEHQVAKLIVNAGTQIKKNHRKEFNAKVLYDKYHNEKSFVANNFRGQKRDYERAKIPFGFSDFLKLIDNNHFKDWQGVQGRIHKISWNLAGDTAEVDFELDEVYTKNLKESFIEPGETLGI